MKTSIRTELIQHVIETIHDQDLTDFDELHFHAFNEDYYIVYHSRAEEWLKRHEISAFEAIEKIRDYEMDNFGEANTKINPESVVNMYVYILGEELLAEFNLDQDQESLVSDLKEELQ